MTAATLNHIYIIGAGALGGMYASRFQDHNPDSVKLIAGPGRADQYRKAKISVNGTERDFQVISPGDEVPPADLIMVTVKFSALPQAIEDIKPFTGPDTIIISLLNGIGSEEMIAAATDPDHLLHAYAVGMDAVREGTAITYSTMGRIVFGEKHKNGHTSKVLRLKELLERTGIPFLIPEDIERALWTKFMMNVGINQASTILRAPYGAFQQESPARELMIMASREVIPLAGASGIVLSEEDISNYTSIIETLSPEGKTSMLQDLEAGRKTEVDIFAGAVIAMGKAHKIPCPVNETFYRIIKFTE